jgi:hypothetical protein
MAVIRKTLFFRHRKWIGLAGQGLAVALTTAENSACLSGKTSLSPD